MTTTPTTPSDSLKATIGVPGLITYYISSIVGVGILIVPGLAAEKAGPASLVAWLLSIAICYPYALVFARMSMIFPESNGLGKFVQKAFGIKWGKIIPIFLSLSTIIGPPTMGIASARYLRNLMHYPEGVLILGIGLVMIWLSIIFNLAGLRIGSKIQGLILGGLIIGILFLSFSSVPYISKEQFVPFAPKGTWAIGSCMLLCYYTVLGWENITSIAEEVKNPTYTFSRAIMWSVSIIGSLYLIFAFAVVGVIPYAQLSENITIVSALIKIVYGLQASKITDVLAVVMLILSTNAWLLGASRLLYALAREGTFPRFLSHVTKKENTPWSALVCLGIFYTIIFGILAITELDEEILINLYSTNCIMIYIVVMMAGVKIFTERKMKIASWVGLLATVALFPFMGMDVLNSVCMALLSIAIGLYVTRSKENTLL